MRSNRKRRQKRRWMDLWMDFFFLILCGIPQAMAILAGGGGVPAPTPATPAGYVAPAAKAAPLAA